MGLKERESHKGVLGRTEQSRAEQSLLPATSQHGHSWHRAPLEPMAIYLLNVKTFVSFSFRCSFFDKKGGVGLFFEGLKPSGYCMHHQLQHTKTLHSAHTVYLRVPFGYHNKQRLFP
jgi:hypothetical protein